MQLTVLAKRTLPNFKTRLAIRRLVFYPLDVFDFVTGKRDPLVPPRGLWFVGGGHFLDNQFKESFVSLGGLQPNHRVLDVGSGIGKQAVPLTKYLSPEGSYEGFDIVEEGVAWCRREITSRFPNFKFQHANVFNKHYNPSGEASPAQWKFPFADAQFDFVFLISVFTHMLPEAVENYLREVGRVLKPGAKCFISYFLMNAESRGLIQNGSSTISLTHRMGNYFVLDPEFPETAIGLPEEFVNRCNDRAGLAIKSVYYGSWCGRNGAKFYQDIIVAERQ
jgi:ubiquinone/menaquinone biosynthesis C-methylase UbiE